MAGKAGVYVQGLRENTRAFEDAGVEVDDLKDVMASVAREAADTMRGFVPQRTGRLAGTVRGNRAKNNATVTVGTKRVAYAWAVRRRGDRFVERTDEVMESKTPALLEQGWADIAERHGLT